MAVSLRLSEQVKKRIVKLSAALGSTPHAFMVAAINEKLDSDATRLAFQAEAEQRLARMKRTGKAIPAAEVFDYVRAKAAAQKPARPKSRRLA